MDGEDKSVNKQESQGDKSMPGDGERSTSAADSWNRSAIDGQKIVSFDRKWTQLEYRNLSPEARRKVDDTVNNIFAVREPGFDAQRTGRKLDDKNPDHKPYIEKWLSIRDEVMTWVSKDGKTEKGYREGEAAKDKASRKERNAVPRKSGGERSASATDSGNSWWEDETAKDKTQRKELRKEREAVPRQTDQKTVSTWWEDETAKDKVQLMGKTDHGQIKNAVLEHFNKTGFDRVRAAMNICSDLKDKDISNLKKTREGMDTLLILSGIIISSKDIKAQKEAARILFSDTSMPPVLLSSLQMSQGILREGYNGKGFLTEINKEFASHKGEEATAALNFAQSQRLTKEHILVARETQEGLKGLTEIRKWLATGSFEGKDKENAEKQLNRISEALVPGSTPEKTKTPAYGRLDYLGSGKELHNFIKSELANESSRETAATNTSKGLSDENLSAAVKNPEGKMGILSIYKALVDGKSEEARLHANRILKILQSLEDPGKLEKRIEQGKVPVFPIRMTYTTSAKPFATLTKDGQINVSMRNEEANYDMTKGETKTLPREVFLYGGKNFKPEEVVGFKFYPEGYTVYRPAAYLLHINNLSVSDTMSKAVEAGLIGLGGPIPKGQILKGAFGLAERGVAKAATALWGASVVVNENKEWLIDKYGDNGRNFIQVMDRAKQYAEIYGMARAMASPVAEKLSTAWNDLRGKSSAADSPKLASLTREIEAFQRAAADTRAEASAVAKASTSSVNPLGKTQPREAFVKTDPAIAFADTQPRPRVSASPRGERPPVTGPPEGLPANRPQLDKKLTPQELSGELAKPAAEKPTTQPLPEQPPAPPNRWRTFVEFQPGKFGYEEYLGHDLFARARRLGMDDDTLFHCVDGQIYRQELLKHTYTRDFTGLKQGVQNTFEAHLTKLESVGAQAEVKKAIENGLNPWQIADNIDRFRSEGLSNTQIRRQFQKQNEYIDYLKRDLCGNDTPTVRVALQTSESDIGVAVANREYLRRLNQWNKDHPGSAVGSKQMTQWSNEADELARTKTREFIGRP